MQRSWRLVGLGGALVAALGTWGVWFRASRAPRAQPPVIRPVEHASHSAPVTRENPAARPRDAAAVARLLATPLPETLRRPGASTMDDALRLLGELAEGDDRSEFFQRLIAFGIERDPRATLDALAALRDEALRDFGITIALGRWSSADPAAALQWAAEHPRGANDHRRFHAAYEGYAAQQPVEALHMLARPELAGDSDALSEVVIFHLDAQDRLAEARAWIEKLPEGNLRDLLVQRVLGFWAATSPEAAVAWLATTASEATFRDGMGTFVRAVADNDPRFAAGLTQRFSEPKIQEDFLADVIYLWAKRDLGGAAAWLHEQAPAPRLDAAFVRMVEATVKFDPVEATAWANAISDPAKRADALRQLRPGG